ncbi:MAG TPA: biotin/lipoyl-containing protein, partial [Chloroflexota bacterium]|nr:biotin/lipoyl-containing protein [Chloroflexota bacterium]
MATPVIMPMLGLTMEEGAVAEWLKQEGEEVRKDEPLFTVEMDKGIVEVPAPASGILRSVSVAVGQIVPVKTVVAEIASAGEPVAAAVAPSTGEIRDLANPHPSPLPLKGEGIVAARRPPAQPMPSETAGVGSHPSAAGNRLVASPRARMRARELGVALDEVAGSGPGGRIMED